MLERRSRVVLVGLALASIAASRAGALDGIQIEHAPAECVLAERFPRLIACFRPEAAVARARVYFRADERDRWHVVEMDNEGDCYAALLPKPQPTLERFSYYVEVLDLAHGATTTAEHRPSVVSRAEECPTPSLAEASIRVTDADLSNSAPRGFAGAREPGDSRLVLAVVGAGLAAATGAALGRSRPERAGASAASPASEETAPTTTVALPAPSPSASPVSTTTRPTTTTTTAPPRPAPTPAPATTTTTLRPATTTTRPDEKKPDEKKPGGKKPDEKKPDDKKPGDKKGDGSAGGAGELSADVARGARRQPRVGWTSHLALTSAAAGTVGELRLNGNELWFAQPGTSSGYSYLPAGEARIELRLLGPAASAASWRVELSGAAALVPGSLRVVRGRAAAVAPESVLFLFRADEAESAAFVFRVRADSHATEVR